MSNYNYVYYTAQINNDGSKSPTNYDNEEPNLEFKEDRKVPIIQNTDEYVMAVESAMFDLKTLRYLFLYLQLSIILTLLI